MQARQDSQLRRCYIADAPIVVGQQYSLPAEAVKHLVSLRLTEDDRVELVNGQGDLATATLTAVSKKSASVRISVMRCTRRTATHRTAWVRHEGYVGPQSPE